MNSQAIKFLRINLSEAYLESFGIKKQFVELGFSSSQYELIEFFVDCEIRTDNQEIAQKIEFLKEADKDAYKLVYFVFANLKKIDTLEFDKKGDLRITFSNSYTIIFDLKSAYDNPLSITFKKKSSNSKYIAVDFSSNGEVTSIEVDPRINTKQRD